ncbi:MAG TPA: M67 family metallopeptidase [Prolixibacteraceae bacterium]|nr:M67 family metallopeptidase [Prolixibacteraceae bacterium]
MLKISRQIINDIINHGRLGLPEEVCGYLAGNDREITRQFELTNVDHSNEHFSFDPAEQFHVVREVRKAGLEILANYHSHPETPARPSQEDIRLAFDPNISYVIVSLSAEVPEIKSFRIQNGEVEKEEIQIVS